MNVLRRTAVLSVIVFCALAAPLFAGNFERVITLEESVITGLNNSQELLTFREQIALAEQRITESKFLIYPKIDLNMNVSQYENTSPVVLSPSFDNMFLPAGNNQNYSTRFSLWQYVYAGGRYATNVRIAETNLSKARNEAEIARSKVILNVKKEFYAYLASRKKVAAYEEAAAEAQALRETNPSEKWNALENRLRFDVLAMKHERETAQLRFLDALGLELSTSIELEGELTLPSEEYDLNKCIAWGFQNRPELRETQFQEKIDSLRINLSIAERYPTLTLGANYEWVGNRYPMNDVNWNATMNLNVPLFDGLAFWSRIKQRRFQAREKIIHKARTEDQVRLEIRQSFLDYNFWRGQVSLLNAQPVPTGDPRTKLDLTLQRIDALREALSSQAALEWAIGKSQNASTR